MNIIAMHWVDVMLAGLGIYLGIGVLFAAAFVWKGASRIDPAAGSTGVPFRLLIVPGSVALWPLLAAKWRSTAGKARHP